MRDLLTAEYLIPSVIAALFGMLYYAAVVKPQDQVLNAIIECMGDRSRQEYKRCVNHLKEQK